MGAIIKYKLYRLIFAFSFMFCTIIPSMPVYATGTSTAGSSTTGDSSSIGTSLYDVSTALTAYVNNVVGANSNDKHNNNKIENVINAGNAGGLVGYGDKSQNFESFVTANTTYGASSSTYDAWQGIININPDLAYQYVRYGRTLADAGLDETGAPTLDMLRQISGWVTLIIYALSQSIPFLFGFAIKMLKVFNPFALLGNVGFGIAHTAFSSAADAARDANPTIYNIMNTSDGLVNFVSGLFGMIMNLSWTIVVPALTAVMAMNILLLRMQPSSQIVLFIKRVVFIGIGVPIAAVLYTSTLNNMGEILTKDTPSTRLVVASFIDFESWVDTSRLSPVAPNALIESSPKGVDGATNDGGAASARMLKQLRKTTLALNKINNAGFSGLSDFTGSDAHNSITGGIWNTGSRGQGFGGAEAELDSDKPSESVFGLLNRYTKGSFYSAAAWSTKTGKYLISTGQLGYNGDNAQNTANAMFASTDEASDWMDREQLDNSAIWAKGRTTNIQWADQPVNIFANGLLTANVDTNGVMTWTNGGLSSLAMYNYLSTSFEPTSLVTYSTANSVSEHTMLQHFNVGIIGSGVLKLLYWANMIVCIGVLALIGLSYSLGMAISNIKRGIQLLLAIPMATLGVLKGIAQVLVYLVLMICEVIGTAFMYSFISELFMVFATMIEAFATDTSITGYSSILFASQFKLFGLTDVNINISLMLIIEILAVLCISNFVLKYNRAYFYGYEYVWRRVYRLCTFKEMLPVYDKYILNNKNTYPFDMPEFNIDIMLNPVLQALMPNEYITRKVV